MNGITQSAPVFFGLMVIVVRHCSPKTFVCIGFARKEYIKLFHFLKYVIETVMTDPITVTNVQSVSGVRNLFNILVCSIFVETFSRKSIKSTPFLFSIRRIEEKVKQNELFGIKEDKDAS